jgi:Rps23 Pro-64 3,4-dihydroxylase Tpa1-like proline 4-hydroxylase
VSKAILATFRSEPFPHVLLRWAVPSELAERTLIWMEEAAPWKLRIASFYEQWEIHLDHEVLPDKLQELLSPEIIKSLTQQLLPDHPNNIELLEVTAHRMVEGQTIKIHNDFREGQETHRILVQLNRGWTDDQGGLLMLFGSSNACDVRRMIRPTHGSGFGFCISATSFHAVSTVAAGERFTLVYSFRETTN